MTSWFFQEFNPLLAQAGELKVVVANKSKVLGRVICRPIFEGSDEVTSQKDTAEELLWAVPLSDMTLQYVPWLTRLRVADCFQTAATP